MTDDLKQRAGDQPLPTRNDQPDIQSPKVCPECGHRPNAHRATKDSDETCNGSHPKVCYCSRTEKQAKPAAPDPDWLVQLRQASMHAASAVRDTLAHGGTKPRLATIAGPFVTLAASQIIPLRAELDQTKRELQDTTGRLADQQTELLQALGSIRALNARLIEQDNELDEFNTVVTRQAGTIARMKVDAVRLQQKLGKALETVAAQIDCPGGCEPNDYCGHHVDIAVVRASQGRCWECGVPESPEMREVPVNEVRGGDTVTVSFAAHDERTPNAIGLWLSEFEGIGVPSMFLSQEGVAVTRPVTRSDRIPDPPIERETVEEAALDDCPGDCRPGVHCGEHEDEATAVCDVPLDEIADGDILTVSGPVSYASKDMAYIDSIEVPLGKAGVTYRVSRPVEPLPTLPGSVGTATVQGRKGVRVMLAPRSGNDRSPWSSAIRVASRFFHAAEEIADYEPLLDGREN